MTKEKKEYEVYKFYEDLEILFDRENHYFYRYDFDNLKKDGSPKMKKLTGVTTIIGYKSNPNLQQWYADMSINHVEDNLAYLQEANVNPYEILDKARYAARDYKDAAADTGKSIHDWIEQYINADLGLAVPPRMPSEQAVLIGVTSFMNWVNEVKARFTASEQIVYSKKYDYAGFYDADVIIKGKKYLFDAKTGNGMYPEVGMQTAAYAKAAEENAGKKIYDGRVALRISKETEAEYKVRMARKPKYRNNQEEIPPYQVFEALFLDDNDNTIDLDYTGFLACKGVAEWSRWSEKNFNELKGRA